jgi:diaminohydroxyphosphoribosylaminopyrimidine deaminase/5-amino-6-(5-phosphoribosylamino)uracil reductase
MERALANALRGWGQTAPNPMVGAVIANGDEVIGDGWHAHFGGPHAEIMALNAAGPRARGATMYVTLEPCTHHGKTPPCCDAIIAAGIRRVVIAASDPNPIAGGGAKKLRAAGLETETGVLEAQAREQNAPFFHSFVSDRPWVTLKLAISRDGAVADPTGRRRWITGEQSRREVHRLRANADAIAVGIGTVLADDPELTVRDADRPRVPPVRIIFDREWRTPLASRLIRTAKEVPTWIIGRPGSAEGMRRLEATGARVIESVSAAEALQTLKSAGIKSLFLEGGPRIAGAFVAEGLVDRLILFDAPVDVGPAAPAAFGFAPPGFEQRVRAMPVIRRARFGGDTMTEFALRANP